jgi:hypothetical protein
MSSLYSKIDWYSTSIFSKTEAVILCFANRLTDYFNLGLIDPLNFYSISVFCIGLSCNCLLEVYYEARRELADFLSCDFLVLCRITLIFIGLASSFKDDLRAEFFLPSWSSPQAPNSVLRLMSSKVDYISFACSPSEL